MIELLEFIFSKFWRFIGFAILLVIVSSWTPVSIKKGLTIDEIKKLIKTKNTDNEC